MRLLRFVLLAGISTAVWGQAMVEYGLGIAAAGTAGAPGQAAGKALGGIFANLSKSLNATADSAKATAAAPAAASAPAPAIQPKAKAEVKPAAPAKPAVVYEAASGISAGMERSEVLTRFGEPAMMITTGAGRESMTYNDKDRRIEVEVRDGKVTSVQSKATPKQTAIVVLQ